MELVKSFRLVIGILLILSGVTIIALIFLEPEALAVFFNFGLDITASNIGELIVGAVAGLLAGLVFLLAMFIIGIFYLIFYVVLGSLTLGLKWSRTIVIIAIVFTAIALFLEIRALVFLSLGGFTSIIMIIRTISDVIIMSFSGYILSQHKNSK